MEDVTLRSTKLFSLLEWIFYFAFPGQRLGSVEGNGISDSID